MKQVMKGYLTTSYPLVEKENYTVHLKGIVSTNAGSDGILNKCHRCYKNKTKEAHSD